MLQIKENKIFLSEYSLFVHLEKTLALIIFNFKNIIIRLGLDFIINFHLSLSLIFYLLLPAT